MSRSLRFLQPRWKLQLRRQPAMVYKALVGVLHITRLLTPEKGPTGLGL